MTKRNTDSNGWFEVKRNPLSRVGVFPYRGSSVGLTGADASRIVRVLRPEEELSDPECVASFRLLPWTDEHAMLGPEDSGLMPAEAKGVHGVIGENVEYDSGVLYANIKAFSNSLGRLIEAGKKQLSAGYRCVYDWTSGVWKGQPYDCVQRKIRGNHLALVSEGRMGPSVAVLDHMQFSFDAQEAVPMDPTIPNPNPQPGGEPNPKPGDGTPDPNNPAARLTLAEVGSIMQAVVPMLSNLQKSLASLGGGGGGAVPGAKPGENGDPSNPHPNLDPKPAPGKDGDPNATPNPQQKPNPHEDAMDNALKEQVGKLAATVDGLVTTVAAMDTAVKAAIAGAPTVAALSVGMDARDKLADRLAAHVGTFDAKDKDLQAVAVYGCEKLGLKPPAGSELVAVESYLIAADKTQAGAVRLMTGQDAASTTAPADNFLSRKLAAATK